MWLKAFIVHILTRFILKCPKPCRMFIVIIIWEEIDESSGKPMPNGLRLVFLHGDFELTNFNGIAINSTLDQVFLMLSGPLYTMRPFRTVTNINFIVFWQIYIKKHVFTRFFTKKWPILGGENTFAIHWAKNTWLSRYSAVIVWVVVQLFAFAWSSRVLAGPCSLNHLNRSGAHLNDQRTNHCGAHPTHRHVTRIFRVPTPNVEVMLALETRGCGTISAVTVNRFDNGKSNAWLHRKKFSIQTSIVKVW